MHDDAVTPLFPFLGSRSEQEKVQELVLAPSMDRPQARFCASHRSELILKCVTGQDNGKNHQSPVRGDLRLRYCCPFSTCVLCDFEALAQVTVVQGAQAQAPLRFVLVKSELRRASFAFRSDSSFREPSAYQHAATE